MLSLIIHCVKFVNIPGIYYVRDFFNYSMYFDHDFFSCILPTSLHTKFHVLSQNKIKNNVKHLLAPVRKKKSSFCVGQLLLDMKPAWECGGHIQWPSIGKKMIFTFSKVSIENSNSFLIQQRDLIPFPTICADIWSDLHLYRSCTCGYILCKYVHCSCYV